MKKRASAILIAIFLVAAVGSVAFAIGRLFLLDASLAGIYENSTVAYYAAESGIEEGFLRYRYEKNTEFPLVAGKFDITKANRSNLDTLSIVANGLIINPVTPGNQSIYDLNMQYRDKYYGNDVNGYGLNASDLQDEKYGKEFRIPVDEDYKIDISDIVNDDDDINLFLSFCDNSDVCTKDPAITNAFIEARMIGNTPINSPTEIKFVLKSNKNGGYSGNPSIGNCDSGSISCLTSTYSASTMQFIKLITNARNTTTSPLFTDNSNNKFELYLKPIWPGVIGGASGYYVKVGIVPTGGATQIATPFTTVKSTGYFGGVSRTLAAKIDRQAGTVYDLFDFVLYKK